MTAKEFFRGKAYFSAKNGFVDRFIENCKVNNITLKNVNIISDGITAEIYLSDRDKIFSIAEKSGMTIAIIKKSGLPYIYSKYSKRYGIPVGLILAVAVAVLLTSMIWSVEISGTEKIPQEMIVSSLEEFGVKRGVFSDTIQKKDVEFYLESSFEELSWVSVYCVGSRVFVEVREREPQLHDENEGVISNIIASKDGEVIRADIYQGEGKIYPGTAVVKGDLLVSGVVNMRDGSVKFVNSKADINALTKNVLNTSSAMKIRAEEVIFNKDIYTLYFFGLKLPLGFGDKENSFTENRYFIKSRDIVFPVGLLRKSYIQTSENEINLSGEKALLIASYDFAVSALGIYESTVVLSREIKYDFSDQITVEGNFICEENIALRKEFFVDDSGSINQ